MVLEVKGICRIKKRYKYLVRFKYIATTRGIVV